jgi:uncharacterized protein (DUF305 family)
MYPYWILTSCRSLLVLLAIAAVSCKTAGAGSEGVPIVQPGAPGQPSRTISAAAAADRSKIRFTEADVRFMQGMIGHHAQALEMTALLRSRTARDDMKLLARRIDDSQTDEIKMMRRWLDVRGQQVPGEHAHHAPGVLMPGMLTAEEMARLAAAQGPAFDRLFLEFMIKHHEGALVMVKELFAASGAGQEPEIFAFASDVDADQRMEIERMGVMLKELPK